jgi:hydroxyacylglutathione hydrolase
MAIEQIIPILLPLPLKLSSVNSYLIQESGRFFLVDTGMTNARRQLESILQHYCPQPGDLKLILLTHGDFDHTGNARYIRDVFRAPIAMHQADSGMLEKGDMFWNRKIKNGLMKKLIPLIARLGRKEQCKPDILLVDGDSLAEYGLEAQVLNTPGHSSGSLCFLTTGEPLHNHTGDLFCGDLLTNGQGKPMLNSMMYDKPAGEASLARLKIFEIKKVYPGHGKAFNWDELENK